MILLDTHVWIWLVDGNPRLTTEQQNYLHQHESQGLAVSVISCWEVAKLVEVGREVPEDLYRAVAEILAFVYRVRGKLPPA